LSWQVTRGRQQTECATPQLASSVAVHVLDDTEAALLLTTTEASHHTMQLWARTGQGAHPMHLQIDPTCLQWHCCSYEIRSCNRPLCRSCSVEAQWRYVAPVRVIVKLHSHLYVQAAKPLLASSIALRAEAPLLRTALAMLLG
jgi:hypothetical protein